MLNKVLYVILALLLFSLAAGVAGAAPPRQAPEGEEYIVQGGDWLTKIADKYYGDPQAYSQIIEATNARAAEDSSFTPITNPDVITVGQKLWIPGGQQQAGQLSVEGLSFNPVTVEALGIQTVVPNNWPAANDADPLLKHAWSAGLFSFVSFTTTPGNDPGIGLARILGVAREDLDSPLLGGQLSEQQVAGRNWAIYTREEGGITSAAAATVQDKVIYQVNLFAETSQMDLILTTILSNFEIIDPAVAQQAINITAPGGGVTLTNPFELRGATAQYPFRGGLIYRVLDAGGNQVGRDSFTVVGQVGNPATFAVPGAYSVNTAGPGTVEVLEISAADGTVIAIDSVGVMLAADPDGYLIGIDDPRPFASVSSPVQVRGKTSDRPFEGRLNYRVVNAAGQELASGVIETRGQVGETNIFDAFIDVPVAADGPARIEVFNIRPADGATFALGTVNVWLTTTP